jgi:hypothetical protein
MQKCRNAEDYAVDWCTLLLILPGDQSTTNPLIKLLNLVDQDLVESKAVKKFVIIVPKVRLSQSIPIEFQFHYQFPFPIESNQKLISTSRDSQYDTIRYDMI